MSYNHLQKVLHFKKQPNTTASQIDDAASFIYNGAPKQE